jgi:DNA-3-methyladenine glycosylase
LVRALEPVSGIAEMAEARGLADLDLESARDLRQLASGPGKLCEALGITRPRDNGKDMLASKSDLQVASDGFRVADVAVTQRIGITKSAEMPLRYIIPNSPFVSRR